MGTLYIQIFSILSYRWH